MFQDMEREKGLVSQFQDIFKDKKNSRTIPGHLRLPRQVAAISILWPPGVIVNQNEPMTWIENTEVAASMLYNRLIIFVTEDPRSFKCAMDFSETLNTYIAQGR